MSWVSGRSLHCEVFVLVLVLVLGPSKGFLSWLGTVRAVAVLVTEAIN